MHVLLLKATSSLVVTFMNKRADIEKRVLVPDFISTGILLFRVFRVDFLEKINQVINILARNAHS